MATVCRTFELSMDDGAAVVRVCLSHLIDESALDDAALALYSGELTSPDLVVVDLSSVAFMSSSGLGALLRLRRAVGMHSGRMALRGLQPHVREVLQITRLDHLFEIADGP